MCAPPDSANMQGLEPPESWGWCRAENKCPARVLQVEWWDAPKTGGEILPTFPITRVQGKRSGGSLLSNSNFQTPTFAGSEGVS